MFLTMLDSNNDTVLSINISIMRLNGLDAFQLLIDSIVSIKRLNTALSFQCSQAATKL